MQKHILKNGLTVLLNPINHVRSVSLGVFAKTGSAHETEKLSGISHFLEHMLFKGTPTRSAKEISSAIEGKGGMLNASTGKEVTCYYVRVVDTELSTAIDVLSDMYLNSVFDHHELETEKKVVLEEISRYLDDPEGFVHDLFIQQQWVNNAYGKEILGNKKSVQALTQKDLRDYVNQRYSASNTIISVAGNFNPDDVLLEIERKFESISSSKTEEIQTDVLTPSLKSIVTTQDIEQSYFCLGYNGVASADDKKAHAMVLNTILGGEMYSRLFQEIREKRGLAYSVGSYLMSTSKGGLLITYGGINSAHWDEVQDIIQKEMKSICNGEVPDSEFEMAQNTLVGQSVLSQETPSSIMMRMANCEITYGREMTLDEQILRIQKVTKQDVIDFANLNCTEDKSSFALISPSKKQKKLLNKLRGK